jgi:hypothetical protein
VTAAGATAGPARVRVAAATGGSGHAVLVRLTGIDLTGITSTPLSLTPGFAPTDTDDVWYCASGTTHVTLALSSSGTLTHGTQSGPTVTVPVSVVSDQAVVIAPDGTQHWIPCLPAHFPHLTVTTPRPPTPAYYLVDFDQMPSYTFYGLDTRTGRRAHRPRHRLRRARALL